MNKLNKDYIRITSGERLDDRNKPYTIIYINHMIESFIKTEEYEKCHALTKVKSKLLDHKNNFLL